MRIFCLIFCLLFFSCSYRAPAKKEITQTDKLNLSVIETRDHFVPYDEFCQSYPAACNLSGKSIIELTPDILSGLSKINLAVNHGIKFRPDSEQYQREEFWCYPLNGFGDCEDIALEKRARLVEFGFPRGALRIAIVHHKKNLTAHAVLTVETNKGTYIMDNENDQIQLWYLTPYNFETRERTDNRWDRFDQSAWSYTDE